MLDGKTRLSIVEQRAAGDLKEGPRNHLQALFRDNSRRRRLSDLIKDAIGYHIVIDQTLGGILRVALTETLLPDADLERSLSDEVIEYFRQTMPINEMSDGIKAYVGLMSAVFCADQKVILIDEPEAFLYPHWPASSVRH